MGIQSRLRLFKRLADTRNQTACENELGDFQFAVLCAIGSLPRGATVKEVIQLILREAGDVVDEAQTHVAVKSFLTKNRSWIRMVHTRRPRKFVITAQGHRAVKMRVAHIGRLLEFGQNAAQTREKH